MSLPVLSKRVLKRLRSSQPFNALTTSFLRVVFQLLRVQPERIWSHLPRVGRARSRLPNGRVLHLWSQGDDWVSNQVFWRGWHGYEPETTPLFFQLAQKSQVTLDIGAHVGFFTVLAAHANPRGRVFAFEPFAPIVRRLQLNVAVNRLRNVAITQSAVGAQSGTANFYHIEEGLPSTSSLSLEFMQDTPGLTHSSVPVLQLDEWVQQQKIARVDLMKIDTESTEYDVLLGMKNTLQRDHPDIICEVLRTTDGAPIAELLRPMGYRFYLLTPQGPQLHQEIETKQSELGANASGDWFNFLFTTRNLNGEAPQKEVVR